MSNKKVLDQDYWEAQYKTNATGWDLGKVSPPIKEYIDTLNDKDISILIPGCGNSHEAEYLLSQGFINITLIDIAPTLVENLQEKFKNNSNIKIVLGDFFTHQGEYDLVIEQTFFCALPPIMRQEYVVKMNKMLKDKGLLVGLLFNKSFESGPPFGGSQAEYEQLFKDYFEFNIIETCYNSITPRANTELFIKFQKI
jgi:SAM-dependent methyltransferase